MLWQAKLDLSALRSLGELCSYETASFNSFVFMQGDTADAFFIVLKGSVRAPPDPAQRLRCP